MNMLPRQVDCVYEWKHLICIWFKAHPLFFSAAEQFSINLKAQDITIQEATRGAELLKVPQDRSTI